MIVSASYKTDIPAFYGEWFAGRLRAGFCKTVNPYSNRVSRVSLRPEDVDGFVFWTKNVGPFLPRLAEVHGLGVPFVVQHTINAYPRELERSVVDAGRAVDHFRRIAEQYGPRVCVWRYDTILSSTLTPQTFHVNTFARLAAALDRTTDEVVVSFAHVYRKTRRNLDQTASEQGFEWDDPDIAWKRSLATELAGIAASHRIRLTVCSQPEFLVPAAGEARCVDADRLADVGGRRVAAKEKGNREGCRCSAARDIGEYDTCPHGCVYCYAVTKRSLALEHFKAHDPASEFLFPPPPDVVEGSAPQRRVELSLFDNAGET